MLERVFETISRYNMFAHGQRVAVAVSGGADSVCLLHAMLELAPRRALRLSVLHLDHGLRGDASRGDAQFVRELADRLGLSALVEEVEVGRLSAERRENLEQVARQARREFFLRVLREGHADCVALGHTRSDQAETVLFRLLRGTGTAGIAGMSPVSAEGFARPLLEVDRADVEQFLLGRGIAWREDESNKDLRFVRNRLRRQLLPQLAREWNPRISEVLAKTATLAQEEEAFWRREVDRLAGMHLEREASATLLRTGTLDSLDLPLARRLVRRAIEWAKGDLKRLDFDHIEQVLALARKREGEGSLRLPGLDVERSFDWLRFCAPAPPPGYRIPLSVPGRFPVPGTGRILSLELLEITDGSMGADLGYNECEGHLDWSRIRGQLELRNWRPGDQYRPIGHARDEKIKLLFQKERIPSWERQNWPIVTEGESVIWTRRFGPAAGYAPAAGCRRILRVTETREVEGSGNLRGGLQRL